MSGVTVGWHFQNEGPKNRLSCWFLNKWGLPEYYGELATQGWELKNCKSLGIVNGRWRLKGTGPPKEGSRGVQGSLQ